LIRLFLIRINAAAGTFVDPQRYGNQDEEDGLTLKHGEAACGCRQRPDQATPVRCN
jgi:hypothetical protein